MDSMATYVARRLLIAVPVLFGVSVLVFVFVALAPGDAVSAYVGPGCIDCQQLREVLTRQLGLDQPLPIRYVHWLAQTLQGNLGYTAIIGLPVGPVVADAFRASVALIGTALVAGLTIGVPLGVLSALRQYSVLDFALTGTALLGISTPSFLLGLGFLYVFGLQFRMFPIGGMTTPSQPFEVSDFLAHLVLPAIALTVYYVAVFMRYTRAAMLDVIGSPYITTAESKGLPPRVVTLRHAFRNALIPIITVVGLTVPEIVGGAVIVENIFSWPGMGSLMTRAVIARDFQMIMAVSLVVSVAILAANLLTDIAYAVVDRRISY